MNSDMVNQIAGDNVQLTLLWLLITHLATTPIMCAQFMAISVKKWWLGFIIGVFTPVIGPLVLGIWALVVSFGHLSNELAHRPPRQPFEGRSDLAFNTLSKLAALGGPLVLLVVSILMYWLPWESTSSGATTLTASDMQVLVGGVGLPVVLAVIAALCSAPRWANALTVGASQVALFFALFTTMVYIPVTSRQDLSAQAQFGPWLLLVVTIAVLVGCLLFVIFVTGPRQSPNAGGVHPPIAEVAPPPAAPPTQPGTPGVPGVPGGPSMPGVPS